MVHVLGIVAVLIVALVVVGLLLSAYFKMKETDLAAARAVAGEKRRLGLSPEATLPRASSTLPNAV